MPPAAPVTIAIGVSTALVVPLTGFGGLTIPEIAAEVKVAERTVKNDWALARDRLEAILLER